MMYLVYNPITDYEYGWYKAESPVKAIAEAVVNNSYPEECVAARSYSSLVRQYLADNRDRSVEWVAEWYDASPQDNITVNDHGAVLINDTYLTNDDYMSLGEALGF